MKKMIQPRQQDRRGAALMEFAIICPILLTLVLGTIEIGMAMRASTTLTAAIREGGRLASMDFSDRVAPGETPNEKVERDIKNFISAAGFNGGAVSVSITHEGGSNDGSDFDLNDSDNNLELFSIRATLPYSAVSIFPVNYMEGKTLAAETVFRATRSSLAQ